jgi:hypothetical protein
MSPFARGEGRPLDKRTLIPVLDDADTVIDVVWTWF